MKGLTKKENEWWNIYQQRDIAYRADAEEFEWLLKRLAKCKRVIKGYLNFHDVSAYKGKYGETLDSKCKCDNCIEARRILAPLGEGKENK